MAINTTQRKQIINGLKSGKRQYEIAKDIGITRSAVQHYAKMLKAEANTKDASKYFIVELYAKTVSTI